jgi:hypothetical protein
MRKEALLVGVGNTRGYAEPLPGAVVEMYNWEELLKEQYGFTRITTREDAQANKKEVLRRFEELLTDAEADDQLVLGFWSHGRVVKNHNPADDNHPFEEAILVYPDKGDASLRSAEITNSDLAAIVRRLDLSEYVDLCIIADLCYAGYLDFPIPPGAKRMFVPPAVDFNLDVRLVREFGSFPRPGQVSGTAWPLVLAACGREEEALHLEIDGKSRTLFSWRALDWLQGHRDITFDSLVHDIHPLKTGIVQTAEIRGNQGRGGEKFPGQPRQVQARFDASTIAAGAGMASSSISAAASSRPARAAIRTALTTPLDTVDVTFQGMCCFAQAKQESDPYQKRVLLPYDDRVDPDMKHIAFIEIVAEGNQYDGAPPTATEPHYGAGYLFNRWHLYGHRIVFSNADTSTPLRTTWSYEEHVAGMYDDVYPTGLRYHPKDDCFIPFPPPDLVAGYVDLSCGILTAGPLEAKKTRYTFKDGSPSSPWYRREPEFVTLLVPLLSEGAEIEIYSEAGLWTTIHVKRGTSVRIGNMRAIDIFGDPNASEVPREHFKLFYNLSADDVGDDPPLPSLSGVPVNSCSVHGWP